MKKCKMLIKRIMCIKKKKLKIKNKNFNNLKMLAI